MRARTITVDISRGGDAALRDYRMQSARWGESPLMGILRRMLRDASAINLAGEIFGRDCGSYPHAVQAWEQMYGRKWENTDGR